jgi:flagellar biosynthesis protein FlhF
MSSLDQLIQAQSNPAVLAERWILKQPPHGDLQASLENLEERLGDLERTLHMRSAQSDTGAEPWIEQAYTELTSAGLSEVLARAIAEKTSLAWRSSPAAQGIAHISTFRRILVESIVSELEFAQPARCSEGEPFPTLVFTGPPGAGKTTTLTKIAVQEFLNRRIAVRIISVDPHHPSCHEKIRTLAGAIGASFAAVDTVSEFRAALRDFSGQGPLLIDTPGYAVAERDALRELADCLSEVRPRQTQLVLPAWTSKRNLSQILRQYEPLAPDAFLFTQLDETEWYGAMIALALEMRKPLSFFASGQNISEDLMAANPQAVFESLYHGHRIEPASTACGEESDSSTIDRGISK